jgi:hypothetical protein
MAQFLLQRQLRLIDLRIPEVPVEIDSIGHDEISAARKNIGKRRRTGIERAEVITALRLRRSSGGQRAVDSRVRDAPVIMP